MLGTCHAAQSPSEQKPEETDFSFHNKIVVKSIYASTCHDRFCM
jgi:hypothetical protein